MNRNFMTGGYNPMNTAPTNHSYGTQGMPAVPPIKKFLDPFQPQYHAGPVNPYNGMGLGVPSLPSGIRRVDFLGNSYGDPVSMPEPVRVVHDSKRSRSKKKAKTSEASSQSRSRSRNAVLEEETDDSQDLGDSSSEQSVRPKRKRATSAKRGGVVEDPIDDDSHPFAFMGLKRGRVRGGQVTNFVSKPLLQRKKGKCVVSKLPYPRTPAPAFAYDPAKALETHHKLDNSPHKKATLSSRRKPDRNFSEALLDFFRTAIEQEQHAVDKVYSNKGFYVTEAVQRVCESFLEKLVTVYIPENNAKFPDQRIATEQPLGIIPNPVNDAMRLKTQVNASQLEKIEKELAEWRVCEEELVRREKFASMPQNESFLLNNSIDEKCLSEICTQYDVEKEEQLRQQENQQELASVELTREEKDTLVKFTSLPPAAHALFHITDTNNQQNNSINQSTMDISLNSSFDSSLLMHAPTTVPSVSGNQTRMLKALVLKYHEARLGYEKIHEDIRTRATHTKTISSVYAKDKLHIHPLGAFGAMSTLMHLSKENPK